MTNQLSVSIGQATSAGRKAANQDFHGALVPEGETLALKGMALAVADGISTSARGGEAAQTAVKSFLSDYFATPEAWSVRTCAERVIAATNSWLHARNRRDAGTPLADETREQGMVCTFTALVLKARGGYAFHVGDGRIARVREGRLEALTEAHRVDLGGGETYLARALGIGAKVEIDFRHVALAPGDVFVLTTDGLLDRLDDAAFVAAAAGPDPDRAALALVEAALASGAEDNLTVQIARIEALPDAEIEDVLGEEAALPPAPRLVPGQTFEGYDIRRELHSGSRSHVYLARDTQTGLRVAIKVPSTEHGADLAELRRLLLEEWIARRVTGTHLLHAPPARATRRHAYAVTEFLQGATLEEWAQAHPPGRDGGGPDLAAVRAIVRQVASGLHALHRAEILHRDLRPANVIVDNEGTARIIDFGSAEVAGLEEIAARADDARFAGTMQFTAPEIWLGERASRASDLWSLAAVTYYLLTHSLPYGPRLSAARTRSAQKRLAYIPATEINPDVPGWLDAALAHALSLDPARRYGELSEFVYDLSHANRDLTAPAPRPMLERRPERVWQAVALILAIALAWVLAAG